MLSAFFSGSETALTSVNRIKLRSIADKDRRAVRLLKIHDDSVKMLSAVLIGNNIVNMAASALATVIAIRINLSVAVMTAIMTFILLIFGEITPKSVAARFSEPVALFISDIIYWLMWIFTPLIFVVNLFSSLILRLFGIDLKGVQNTLTESELRTFVDVSHEEGVIEGSEKKIINNVVDFGDSRAKDIMIPRIDVSLINISASFEDVTKRFAEDFYSRMPVYAEDTDNIVGILNMKDVFFAKAANFRVRDYMRDAWYTYEMKRTSELLSDMKKNSVTMAIVLNEYGAAEGIITMEDLLEEIVGEIRDEYDEDEINLIRCIDKDKRVFDVEAGVKLDDLNDALGTDFDSDDYDSLGGLVIEKLDHLPGEGEKCEMEDGTVFEVISTGKNRIERVKITLPSPAVQEDDQDPASQ
ncbi:MAG: HlyC/CorC family transporter [Lachnospiraceae bacterium]|nr:HlyC/CorC family transporter [Lachnospiraceae bacterium]